MVAETARIVPSSHAKVRGSAVPAFNGVAAVAADLALLCSDRAGFNVTSRLRSRIEVIEGRGACALPDGVRRLVASVLDNFPEHVTRHEHHGACRDARPLALALPAAPLGDGDWR